VLLWQTFGPRHADKKTAAEFFRMLGIAPPPDDGNYAISLTAFLGDDFQRLSEEERDALFDQEQAARERPWTAQEFPLIRAWTDAHETQLAQIVAATKRPKFWRPIIARQDGRRRRWLLGNLASDAGMARDAARLLITRAMRRMAAGRYDQAWDDLLSCHRLARLVAQGPTIVDSLVGDTIEAMANWADVAFLAHAANSGKQFLSCLDDLERLPPRTPCWQKLERNERFNFLDAVQGTAAGDPQLLQLLQAGLKAAFEPPPESGEKAIEELRRADFEPVLRAGNRWYDRLVAVAKVEDLSERRREVARLADDVKAVEPRDEPSQARRRKAIELQPGHVDPQEIGDYLLTQLFPAAQFVLESGERVAQQTENVKVATALAAYRADHRRYPGKLDDLRLKYLLNVPDDRFSGEPLVYRRTDAGYLLYSVGIDGRDDGGLGPGDGEFGEHDDLSIRMPIVRTQP
jgi:hypothetical protein